ncbi:MAG: hypothetical protein ACE5HF_07445 [Gemmatimonadota bacterium]
MLKYVGLPAILAAWTLPALFLLAIAGCIGTVVGHRLYEIGSARAAAARRWATRHLAPLRHAGRLPGSVPVKR